ncbi:MAG: DUF4493 domain-containing protein [Parabacteroides sp.]|nr:DUF4493 domain-containing protein [Parabacteroides sp.]
MKRVKGLFKSMMGLLLGGFLVTSCQSEDFSAPIQAEGKGTITLDLNAMAGFETETKAVNEADYRDISNYTVEITDMNQIKTTYNTSELQSLVLPNGGYSLKAFYGEEKNASQDVFYSVGTTSFNVHGETADNPLAVSVTCKPTCAKVNVVFDDEMATYFDNYYVEYDTEKGSPVATWTKENVNPWYLLVNKNGEEVTATIHLVAKETYKPTDNKVSIEKKYTLSPNKGWTLSVAPSYTPSNGSLGIEITIDETTDSVPVDIIIPAEWQ